MKNIQNSKLRDYFRWKLEAKSYEISDVRLARYLKITPIESLEIIQDLCKQNIVSVNVMAHCPECSRSYKVKSINMNDAINCIDCNYIFIPSANERLLTYQYCINTDNEKMANLTEKKRQRKSILKLLNGKEEEKMNNSVKVFLSYCHADEEYKNKLDAHLAPLKRNNKIEAWNDRKLVAGSVFDAEIKKHLNEDDIIILLISSDFINSDYCYEIELQKALERMKNNDAKLLAVIIRPCLWQETPLKDIQVLPKDGVPISKYPNEDDGYLFVVKSIKEIIDTL